mgnify:CR=1 FL=1
MVYLDKFKKAFLHPFQDVKSVIIGCLLNILPIINFFSTGYIVEAGKLSLKHKKALPKWENFGHLWITGLLVFLFGLIWSIPALILTFLFVGKQFVSMLTTGSAFEMLPGFSSGIVLVAIVFVLTFYLMPAALMNFIKKGHFGAAFEFKKIFSKALTGKYFVVWAFFVVVYFVLSFIANLIPFANIVLAPAAGYIAYMIGVTAIAHVWDKL